ncbi:isoprenylcysteine carboxylmethyltransferase family protein [Stutzerimonas xanthomarina]|uniref:methyltransferase family protein n=1 Tax=Stutzerimonas xanthomarina TaxID=271420 RepID=UPI0029A0CC5C|nr:isoprenylcysteine carboxylmethyltransferase family protein [Stutzerimonas xanthomarina]MDX2353055.1 isoprenylcysteine carboxylmethyltransferase family protein [Stutzerimonas xanthomarina]
MLQLGVFVVGSAVLVWLSRSVFRQPKSHGFYRFFAWEAILALLVLNAPVWFEDRFAPHQLISWALLFSSIGVLVAGLTLLQRLGKPDRSRADPELFAFEKTSTVVTAGIFRYIRHPLYTSLLLLTWGIFFKQIDLMGLLCGLTATLFLWLTARRDEEECLAHFGEPYRRYMQHSKRFIPFVM